MSWREFVAVDPTICHGRPHIRGARVMVAVIVDYLEAGLSTEEIIRRHPALTPEGVQAAGDYWAALKLELGIGA